MRRNASFIFRLLAVFALANSVMGPMAKADDDEAFERAVKATFVYKFEPFVTWPDRAFSSSGSPFNICVLGDDAFGDLVDRAAGGQQAGNRPIKVLRLRSVSPDDHCQVLYLATGDPQLAHQFLTAVDRDPVLTVTDSVSDGAAKGMINFAIADNRVRFEIDAEAATRSGLTISSKLLSLALPARHGP